MVFKLTGLLFFASIIAYIIYIGFRVWYGSDLDIIRNIDIIGVVIACVMFASGCWFSVWASLKIIKEEA